MISRNVRWRMLPLCFGLAACAPLKPAVQDALTAVDAVPSFAVDPGWPDGLPNGWILGQVTGVAVDANDRVWVLHRPATLSDTERAAETDPPSARCCKAAPPLLVFNADGSLAKAWGEPGGGEGRGATWPQREHSLAIDPRDNSVWLAGNDADDGFIVKYDSEGQFILRIGEKGPSLGNASILRLGRPAGLVVDPAANEVFVADGYANNRVIVFDAATGRHLRHWGAYGERPSDSASAADPLRQLSQPHGISLMGDDLLVVGDRPNKRIQIFRRNGTFVREIFDPTPFERTVWDAVPWPRANSRWLLVADGVNNEIRVLDLASGAVHGRVGQQGPYAGQFRTLHNVAVNRRGDIFTAELGEGKRVQRFVVKRR